MKKRSKVNQRKERVKFTKHALKTRPQNYVPAPERGGYRM